MLCRSVQTVARFWGLVEVIIHDEITLLLLLMHKHVMDYYLHYHGLKLADCLANKQFCCYVLYRSHLKHSRSNWNDVVLIANGYETMFGCMVVNWLKFYGLVSSKLVQLVTFGISFATGC